MSIETQPRIAVRRPSLSMEGFLYRDPDYPESDGKPMADNTRQWDWIADIKLGLERLYGDDPNVFVAADLLWYPVRGRRDLSQAPDVLVAIGRPKGHRGSYLQWREDGMPPQVVFEILSPNNTAAEMKRKLEFYERYGVDEYYIYDPGSGRLKGYLRDGERLARIPNVRGWISPRLTVRFDLGGADGKDLVLTGPDGRRFLTYTEMAREREAAERVGQEAQARAERLATRLRELGVDPDAL